MEKFETIFKLLDSADEYISKAEIYEPLISLLDEMEDLSLTTKDYLQKLLRIYSFKLKYYLLDHPSLALSLENNCLSDKELLILLKELIAYERRHL